MLTIAERRKQPRAACDYQAIIQVIDMHGNKYEENAKLVNLSAGGLFMWTNRVIEQGSKLSVTVLFNSAPIFKEPPRLATKGIVVRTEPQTDGSCGIAVQFSSYRFL